MVVASVLRYTFINTLLYFTNMLPHLSYLLCAGVAVGTAATILTREQLHPQALHQRSIDGSPNTTQQLVLPMNDPNPSQRAQDIQTKQQGYLYGPSVMGNSSWFPSGPLGEAMIKRDAAVFKTDLDFVIAEAARDMKVADAALAAVSMSAQVFMILSDTSNRLEVSRLSLTTHYFTTTSGKNRSLLE